jgi:uncharacterized protein
MAPMKLVLDTNLFVAAYWNRGSASAKIIDACLRGEFQAVYTPDMEHELWIIMRAIHAREEYAAGVSNFLARAQKVQPWASVQVQSEDPDDQKFLVCAVSAGADYIVTSDIHLLKLEKVDGTEIIKPGELWRSYNADRRVSEES